MSNMSKNDEENRIVFLSDDVEKTPAVDPAEERRQRIKRKRRAKRKANVHYYVVACSFSVLFLAMILYFTKYIGVESEQVVDSTYNARIAALEKDMIRGKIVARDGTVLAGTNVYEDQTMERIYPYANVFSHVVGYVGAGKSGLEDMYNTKLLTSHVSLMEREQNELYGIKNHGDTLKTTFDVDVQMAAYHGLSVCNGAVVVIKPDTGEILAEVSKPDFDPNDIERMYEFYTMEGSTDTNLLNRAMQGLYPPGSTFKIFTTTAYLRSGKSPEDYSFNCSSSFRYGDAKINCIHNKAHGKVGLKESFAQSCNSSFANIGTEVGPELLAKTCDSLLFKSNLPTDFNYNKSAYHLPSDATADDILQTSIGQGQTLVTPYHMALIASAIANDGVLMKPYMVSGIESKNGDFVSETKPSVYKRLFTVEEAQYLQEYMAAVVTDGTGEALKNGTGYTAYGKTGSAEFLESSKAAHSWFVGYAQGDNGEKIALAIIYEGMGNGSRYAVPLAKEIFDAYFN